MADVGAASTSGALDSGHHTANHSGVPHLLAEMPGHNQMAPMSEYHPMPYSSSGDFASDHSEPVDASDVEIIIQGKPPLNRTAIVGVG